jgi:hypothetical protein
MKKKLFIIYMVLTLVILLISTNVYATISGNIKLSVKSENSTLRAGDNFSLTLSLSDMKSTDGITAIEGYININKDILENLTVDSIVATDGKVTINKDNVLTIYEADDKNANTEEGIVFNTEPVSGKGNYKLVINLANKITDENIDLITIKFKIKDNAEQGEYNSAVTYDLFKVFSNDASEKVEVATKSVKLVVSAPLSNSDEDPEENPSDNENNTTKDPVNNTTNNTTNNITNNTTQNTVNNTTKPTNNTTNKTTNNSTSVSSTSTNNVDNTVSKTNLPNTGYRLILIPVIVVAILGLVFYKKYTKYNKYN